VNKRFETNRVIDQPKAIYVHPNWLPFNQNYDADIALMVLTQSIQFNAFVQPICMWNSNDAIPATSGVVIGYGRNGNSNDDSTRVPKKIQIFIHRNEECIAAEPLLKSFSSDRTLCGESVNGNFICYGDSGHAFVVQIKTRFYLRGIISSSPKGVNNSCTFTHYGVYSNVLMYREWIENPEDTYPDSTLCGLM
jgi:secreted trypsin-like serine protease